MAIRLHFLESAYTQSRVNEFYKKGCQEKTSASTGGREHLCLDIQLTVWRSVPRFAQGFYSGWFSLRLVSLPVATMPIEPERLSKRE